MMSSCIDILEAFISGSGIIWLYCSFMLCSFKSFFPLKTPLNYSCFVFIVITDHEICVAVIPVHPKPMFGVLCTRGGTQGVSEGGSCRSEGKD